MPRFNMAGEKETEAFIEAVKKRPVLYDRAHPDYNYKKVTNRTWADIVKELDLVNIRLAKMRWKNIKDTFVKHRRYALSKGRALKSYRNWKWSDHMKFLEPYIHPSSSRNIVLKRERSPISIRNGHSEFETELEELETQGNNAEVDFSDNDPLEAQVSRPVAESIGNGQQNADVEHLFLSYAETFKKFPKQRQLLIKGQLAAMFLKAEMDTLQEQGVSTTVDMVELQKILRIDKIQHY